MRVARTRSTQDVVLQAARDGADEGFCCLAAEQTSGRGRQGREWVAPPGTALLASVLLRRSASVAPGIPFAAGLALVDVLGAEEVGAYYPHRVTYHPTCHSLRLLRVGERPLRLLRNVAGIDLVELPDAEVCCGFGGTFALKNADVSTAMLADKMRNVVDTRAQVCTAGDSSCLMHIGGGLSRLRAGVKTVHLAEILASTREAG